MSSVRVLTIARNWISSNRPEAETPWIGSSDILEAGLF